MSSSLRIHCYRFDRSISTNAELYLEDFGKRSYNADGGPSGDHWAAKDCTFNVAWFAQRFGLGGGHHCALVSDSQRKQILNFADLLLNVLGDWSGEKNTCESVGSHTSTAIRCSRKSSWHWERRVARCSTA